MLSLGFHCSVHSRHSHLETPGCVHKGHGTQPTGQPNCRAIWRTGMDENGVRRPERSRGRWIDRRSRAQPGAKRINPCRAAGRAGAASDRDRGRKFPGAGRVNGLGLDREGRAADQVSLALIRRRPPRVATTPAPAPSGVRAGSGGSGNSHAPAPVRPPGAAAPSRSSDGRSRGSAAG